MSDDVANNDRTGLNQFFWELADTTRFAGRVIQQFFRKPYEWSEFGRQCYLTGVKSLALISITAFIMGLVLTMQTRPVFSELGADAWLPGIIMVSIIREIGPVAVPPVLRIAAPSWRMSEYSTPIPAPVISDMLHLDINSDQPSRLSWTPNMRQLFT